VREGREPVHVLPHRRIRRVEQVRTVPVHLDARLGLVLAVRVATDVRATVDHRDVATGCRSPLRDREAEEARTDDEKIHGECTTFPSPAAKSSYPPPHRALREFSAYGGHE